MTARRLAFSVGVVAPCLQPLLFVIVTAHRVSMSYEVIVFRCSEDTRVFGIIVHNHYFGVCVRIAHWAVADTFRVKQSYWPLKTKT